MAKPSGNVGSAEDRTFVDRLEAAIGDEGSEVPAERVLRRYLSTYDGAHFQDYDVASAQSDGISPGDLVAVTFLSMEIRRGTTSGFTPSHARSIDAARPELTALLAQIPLNRELHSLTEAEFEGWVGNGSPAERLWHHLRDQIGIPRVATYKLLARKRPHLLPIRDRAASRALSEDDPWWQPWWTAPRSSQATAERLAVLRQSAGSPEVSLLRIADIIIWMRYR